MVTVDDGIDEFDAVLIVDSLLLSDVCLDIDLLCGENILCCFEVDVLVAVVGVDGKVFCETMVEYCRTG